MKKHPIQFLLNSEVQFPNKIALTIEGNKYTFNDLRCDSLRLASFFKEQAVLPNMRIGLYSDDDYEVITSIFALWFLGAIPAPINIKQAEEKLKQTLKSIDPHQVFYGAGVTPLALESGEMSFISKDIKDDQLEKTELTEENEICLMLSTSGSSGVPKIVPISSRAIFLNACHTAERLEIISDDKLYINTPPYTTSSLLHVLTMLSQSASIVIDRGILLGSALIEQLMRYNCTGFAGVPAHLNRLVAALSKRNNRELDLKFVMNSGDHLSANTIEKLTEYLPNTAIHCVYGLTEVAGRLCILDSNKIAEKKGSVGLPLSGMKVTVKNESGNVCEFNEIGEVIVSGEMLTKGYYNNSKINKIEFKADGFHTGDIGYKDEDGYLFLKGRRDDIIKVGGEKVSVKSIEDAIAGFPDFKDFVVCPYTDEGFGRIPCLIYTLDTNKHFNRFSFIRFLKDKLPTNNIPTKFFEVNKILKNASGKVIRKESILREKGVLY